MNVRAAIIMQDKASQVLRNVARTAENARSSIAKIGGPVRMSINNSGAISSIQAVKKHNDQFNNSLDRTGEKADLLNSKFSKWTVGIWAAVHAIQNIGGAVTAVTDKVDEYTNMRARLDLINDGNQTTGA